MLRIPSSLLFWRSRLWTKLRLNTLYMFEHIVLVGEVSYGFVANPKVYTVFFSHFVNFNG